MVSLSLACLSHALSGSLALLLEPPHSPSPSPSPDTHLRALQARFQPFAESAIPHRYSVAIVARSLCSCKGQRISSMKHQLHATPEDMKSVGLPLQAPPLRSGFGRVGRVDIGSDRVQSNSCPGSPHHVVHLKIFR